MAFNASSASAGATIGAAVGSVIPVVGTVIGGAIGGLLGGFAGGSSSGAAGGAGGADASATPMSTAAQAAAMGSGLDGSAWIVNFGNGNSNTLDNRQDKTVRSLGPTSDATANTRAQSANPYDAYGGYLDGGGTGLFESVNPLIWVILAGAVIYRLNKKKG